MKASPYRTPRKARARLRLARDRIAQADYSSAIPFLRSALRQLEREPASLLDRAQCYIELARCYNLQGDHPLATPYCRWALNLLRREWNAELERAEAELELGIALAHTDQLHAAQRHLTSAYRTFEAYRLWAKAALCIEHLGMLARQQEQVVRAINAFHYAKRLYQQVEDLAGVHRMENQLRELIPKE